MECSSSGGLSVGEALLMTSLSIGMDVTGPVSSPSSPVSSSGGTKTVGEVMREEVDSLFISTMRTLFERAAAEKEKRERRDCREKKMNRLETKIREMSRKVHGSGIDEILYKINEQIMVTSAMRKISIAYYGIAKKIVDYIKHYTVLFKTASAAAIHDRKVHKKSIKQEVKAKDPISCEECGKLFASTFQLKEHISILHLRERKFECEVCGQKFGRRGGVRRHVQMVHLNQLHKCPYDTCDHPGYKCSKALAAHIRSVHTNIRPYECDVCGKNFVRRNDLKMHELTHTEEAAFHCSCGSSFRRALYLKKHQRQCPCSSEVNSPEYDSPAE